MENKKSTNVIWHQTNISKEKRQRLLNQKGVLLWFTGLSGSGKSTVSSALEKELYSQGKLTYLLDGDNVRHGLNGDLGFSEEDRKENLRRIREVSKLFVDAGVITLASFISPFKADRAIIREMLGDAYIEIFVDCSLEVCEARDPKGLYKKVRSGNIKNFTGVDAPYEIPDHPDIVIKTDEQTLEATVNHIMTYLDQQGILSVS